MLARHPYECRRDGIVPGCYAERRRAEPATFREDAARYQRATPRTHKSYTIHGVRKNCGARHACRVALRSFARPPRPRLCARPRILRISSSHDSPCVLLRAARRGCLGIEGTDVSTGAAPSTTGDGGYDSTATADPATTEPSTTIGTSPTDTNDDGTSDGASESDSDDPTGNDTSGRLSTDSSGEDGATETSGDVVDTDDSTGTDTGTETVQAPAARSSESSSSKAHRRQVRRRRAARHRRVRR